MYTYKFFCDLNINLALLRREISKVISYGYLSKYDHTNKEFLLTTDEKLSDEEELSIKNLIDLGSDLEDDNEELFLKGIRNFDKITVDKQTLILKEALTRLFLQIKD
jgi:hypothetical protein